MNCRDLEELLSAYADGELSRTQREFIEEHLSGCADCREALAEFEAAGRQLTSLRHVPETTDIRAAALSKIKATSTSSRKSFGRWLRPVTATGAAVIVLIIALVQPWSGAPEPQVVLARTYDAVAAVQSYRMTLSSYSTSTADGWTSEQQMEIEFAAPDRYHVVSTSKLNGNLEPDLEYNIIIGDKQYSREGKNTGYVMAGTPSVSSFLERETTLHYLDMLTDIETLPGEAVGSVECLHYKGTWDIEKYVAQVKASMGEAREKAGVPAVTDAELKEMTEAMHSMRTDLELWIGKDDYLIRRIVVEQQMPDGPDGAGATSYKMTMEYSRINEPIIIEPPLDENGDVLPGWEIVNNMSAPVPEPEQEYLTSSIVHTIGSQEGYDDWDHQELRYSINIGNRSSETLQITNVTLFSELIGTHLDVEPGTMGLYLEPGEGYTFHARYPFDASGYSKEEIVEMNSVWVVYVTFHIEDGRSLSEMLYTGKSAPYPTKTPPAGKPTD